MFEYILTGGVHASPLPAWAIMPFAYGVSGLAWAGLTALVARAARGAGIAPRQSS